MDDRPHEGAPRLVQRLAAGDGRHRLRHWHRLAGQHTFVALEFVDLQQTDVGRYQNADAERHDVTGYEVRYFDPALPSVPANFGFLSDFGAERSHRHLRPVLVEEAQPDTQGDDHGDDHCVRTASGQPRYQGGDEQQDQDRVAELAEEDGRGVHPMRTERVRTELS